MPSWTDKVIKPIVRSGTGTRNPARGTGSTKVKSTVNKDYVRGLKNYMQPPAAPQAPAYRGGGGGGGGGGSRGGGYDSGPSAYELWQIEEEKRRQNELKLQKAMLTNQLTGARDQARPLLDQYASQYGKSIGNVFRQNRSQNSGYAQQLRAIQNQMNTQTRGTQSSLRRDLQGQGAGAGDLRAMQSAAGQNVAGANFMGLLGGQYNNRLAQVMSNRHADARNMGATVKASSKGQLENSYAQLLGQIGMIGLGK